MMNRYRKILVAVDGSPSSSNAFSQACKLAKAYKSWVTVITAVPEYKDQFQMPSVQQKAQRALIGEGEKVLDKMRKIADEKDVMIRTVLKEGYPMDEIVDVAEDGNFDLIVMGRRGKSRLEKALMGSVTARVIGHSPVNILIFPENSKIGWRNLLLPVDGSAQSRAATDLTLELAKEQNASINAISVVDVTDEFAAQAPAAVEDLQRKARELLEGIREKGGSQGIQVDTYTGEGEPHKLIVQTAKRIKADMIIMGSHGRTGLKKLLMGSITEKVIGYAPCPVMVVKEKA